ncbi:SVEP1 [Bugula neritina]|uniref:SVEP1 n=1 Tax=Bugula neritina TaxID=10212 RepID=A0A7J7K7X8_BUGNE|nr:SVEP1 [Bugula neritina]
MSTEWQDGPSTAMCSALLCPIMPKVPHSTGWICLNQGRQVSGKYPYRTTCENHCNAGFLPRPDTNEFVICGLDNDRLTGKWSGSGLVSRKCTNLPEVLNGQYNQRDCSHPASDRTFGKVCSVSCNHGFIISEKVEWTCQDDGQWTNYDKTVKCKDITPPQILSCPQHLTVPNEENEGYAIVKLLPLDAIDNDGASTIDQTLHLQPAGSARIDEYPCNSKDCGETTFNLPIGTSTVNFTVSDRSGNSDSCIYQVTVQDVEPLKLYNYVDWKEPEFSDNSGLELKIYPTGSPGEYRVGRTWSFKYTATDTAGNTAQCEFSFKLTGIRCPQLHTPANGALVCDKLAFGIYCVPQCQRGLERLLPDHIRYTPNDYFCSTKGKWLPHDEVGDCAIRVPEDSNGGSPFDVLWFDGDCNDEHTKQSIIQTTLDALNNGGPSFTGQGWKDSQDKPLTVDDFEVFCGPKNESIIQIGRSKREVSYVQGLSATAKLFSGVVLN